MTTTPPTAEDLQRVEDKLDTLLTQVNTLHRSQQMLASLYEEMVPVATLAINDVSEKLAAYEQKGYFDFARETFHVVDSVVQNFSPDDVHALGDNIVNILNAVKAVTQPDVLEFVEHAADAMEDEAHKQPKGVLSMLKSTSNDDDVRRGLAVALEALRQIGKAAHGDNNDGKKHVNRLLGGKRNLRPKGEAKATPGQPASTRKAPMSKEVVQHVQVAMPHAEDTPEHCPTDVEGFTFDRDGFLTQPECWTVELAHTLAHQAGLELHERHWTVLNYLREEYAQSGSSPNIRKITIGSGVPTKELFQLFPRAPAKTAARIAGIPKPVGCV